MSQLSDYAENKLLDHILGGGDYTPAANIDIKLFTTKPTDSTGGTEVVSGVGYTAVTKTNNGTNFPAAASGVKQNGASMIFGPASGDGWGAVEGAALLEGSTSNILVYGGFPSDATYTVEDGQDLSFAIGAIRMTLGTGGNISNYLRNKLLDLMFGGVTYARPGTVYLGLHSVAPDVSGGGTELSGGGYARCAITNNGTNFPAASGGAKSLAVQHLFTQLGSGFVAVNAVAWGLYDAVTGGNLLFFGNLTASRNILPKDRPKIEAGDLTFTLA